MKPPTRIGLRSHILTSLNYQKKLFNRGSMGGEQDALTSYTRQATLFYRGCCQAGISQSGEALRTPASSGGV